MPQQRKLIITLEDGNRLVSGTVTLSDPDDEKLMKTINEGKRHRGKIDLVDLEKVEKP